MRWAPLSSNSMEYLHHPPPPPHPTPPTPPTPHPPRGIMVRVRNMRAWVSVIIRERDKVLAAGFSNYYIVRYSAIINGGIGENSKRDTCDTWMDWQPGVPAVALCKNGGKFLIHRYETDRTKKSITVQDVKRYFKKTTNNTFNKKVSFIDKHN